MPQVIQRRRDFADRIIQEAPLPPNPTPGQRWRFQRNLVIYLAHSQGLSQRFLGEVFDLPRSHIATIVKDFEAHLPDPPSRSEAGWENRNTT